MFLRHSGGYVWQKALVAAERLRIKASSVPDMLIPTEASVRHAFRDVDESLRQLLERAELVRPTA
jgi:hypothetical protein